ncbi:MAG TPA: hypothetical protein VIU37_13485, partial [Candidatus Limnocylindrales bacterium]
MTTALVVPVLSNFAGLAELLASVDEPVLPVVVDNWASNRGVAGGWNAGLRRAMAAGCEHTVLANDDCAFLPGTLGKLVASLGRWLVVSPLNVWEYPDGWAAAETYRPPLDFGCVALRTFEFVARVGLFDENFWPAYWEDIDMQRRLELVAADARGGTRWDAPYRHHVSVTQLSVPGGVRTAADHARSEAYYAAKWGGGIGEETYATPFGVPGASVAEWPEPLSRRPGGTGGTGQR